MQTSTVKSEKRKVICKNLALQDASRDFRMPFHVLTLTTFDFRFSFHFSRFTV